MYGTWTRCNNGTEVRDYKVLIKPCIGLPPADSIQRTCTNKVIIDLQYQGGYVYIESTESGQLVITNVLGNIVKRYKYEAGSNWINVSTLPSGTYYAVSQGRHLLFIKH